MLFCLEEGPSGLKVMAGASGLPRLADLRPAEFRLMAQRLEHIVAGHDLLLLDSAAGVSWQTLLLLHASRYVVLVTNPLLTALTDAYAVAKALCARNPGRHLGVIVNRIRTEAEGESAFRRLSEVMWRFLGERPRLLGMVHEDPGVAESVNAARPFVLADPEGRPAREVKAIADALLAELDSATLAGRDVFSTRPDTFPHRLQGLLAGRRRRW
jgi:flagellar biosynthesis protein FlhG